MILQRMLVFWQGTGPLGANRKAAVTQRARARITNTSPCARLLR
jgi:hypothetical protein